MGYRLSIEVKSAKTEPNGAFAEMLGLGGFKVREHLNKGLTSG
jgi:hypothetical protein